MCLKKFLWPIFALAALHNGLFAETAPLYTGKVFLGLSGDPVAVRADGRHASTFGLKLTRVAAGSSGDLASLRVGDVLVGVDGTSWTNEQIRLSRSFGETGRKASGTSNTYHGGTSLAFFVDAGGGDDVYPTKPNNQVVWGGEHSIFVDLSGPLENALDDAAIDASGLRDKIE